MTDLPGAAAEAAAIHAEFAVSVIYTGAGLTAKPIAAVLMQAGAPVFNGMDQSVRDRTYELRKADLQGDPATGNLLVDGATTYRVIEAIERDDVDAWWVRVEVE